MLNWDVYNHSLGIFLSGLFCFMQPFLGPPTVHSNITTNSSYGRNQVQVPAAPLPYAGIQQGHSRLQGSPIPALSSWSLAGSLFL